MAGILITYRETDANGWVFLLHEKLVEIFGNDQVVLKKIFYMLEMVDAKGVRAQCRLLKLNHVQL